MSLIKGKPLKNLLSDRFLFLGLHQGEISVLRRIIRKQSELPSKVDVFLHLSNSGGVPNSTADTPGK